LPAVCARMAADAHRHFNEAHAAMARCTPRAMRPARLMGASYNALLHRLERRGWARHDPVHVPKWQKLLIALRYAL
ncbi:MAG: squalene/phytoene synthase family protein, partial [Gemmatimonadaceae bacterium]|nr:squalene/phytoene synthase family protein [Acetobacteraceae bacterium]